MKNPAESIAIHLTTDPNKVGDLLSAANTGWRVGVGMLPDTPDTAIIVNMTGGVDPFPHLLLNQPSVQVMIRGTKNGYQAAYAKARAVVAKLLGMATTVLQGDTYRSCIQIGDIGTLGFDENKRPLFSANFRFIVEPVAETGETRVSIT